MHRIGKRFSFSASHFIGGLPAEHPCARLHGHNYEVEVSLQGTTTEVIAAWLYAWCKARWPETVAVRVSETPSSWAEYSP
jgi:6-pyruvoyltetrahydropterin/6-carboxytetrahydropterin synthase